MEIVMKDFVFLVAISAVYLISLLIYNIRKPKTQ